MRFSAVAALCAAPLVLASSLESEFVAKRGADPKRGLLEVRDKSEKSVEKVSTSNKVTVVESTQADVVIIWVNEGGGAATQTVTQTKTVTAAGGAVAAAATHQVWFSEIDSMNNC